MLARQVTRQDRIVGTGDKLRASDEAERPDLTRSPGNSDSVQLANADAKLGAFSPSSQRRPASTEPPGGSARTQLISEIAEAIREPTTPDSARHAGLTLIGWLARRMPEEPPHAIGVEEARASEFRLRSGQSDSDDRAR
jgi:hypothetical protein